MNLIIWLLVGGVIGWLASMLMKTNDLPGLGRKRKLGGNPLQPLPHAPPYARALTVATRVEDSFA